MKIGRTLLPIFLLLLAAAILMPASLQQSSSQLSEARRHYFSARDFIRRSEWDKALAELKAAMRFSPEFVEAHNDYIANPRNQPADIIAEYQAYLQAHPGSATFHYCMGKAYARAGRIKDGEGEYRKALSIDPGFAWALLELGSASLQNQDRAKAGELFEKARKRAGSSAALHLALATRLLEAQRFASARAEAQRTLELDAESYEACTVLWKAKLRLTRGSEKTQAELLRDVRNLEARYPGDAQALSVALQGYQLVFEDQEVNRLGKTIQSLEQKPGNHWIVLTPAGEKIDYSGPFVDHFREAMSLFRDPKTQLEALKKIERETDEENFKLYGLYPTEATISLRSGDLENAERLYNLMAKAGLGSRLSSLQSGLAKAYIDRNIKLDVAQDYVAQAIEVARKALAPTRDVQSTDGISGVEKSALSELLYTQGRLFLARSLTAQAVAPLTESLQLTETESAAFELGLIYSKLNRTEEAIKMLAVAWSFDGGKKAEARAALERIYGNMEKSIPLDSFLNSSAERRKASLRDSAIQAGKLSALEGKTAPGFRLGSISGKKMSLSDFHGKIIVLNFWATW